LAANVLAATRRRAPPHPAAVVLPSVTDAKYFLPLANRAGLQASKHAVAKEFFSAPSLLSHPGFGAPVGHQDAVGDSGMTLAHAAQ